MPHLDEGMLHAYLDNALPDDVALHLQECADCRVNLEEARLLKQNVESILSDAAPGEIAMPSFEDLQKRAMAGKAATKTTAPQVRSISQMKTLAWAATVILAAAVGWYARSTVVRTQSEQYVSEGEPAGRLTIPLPEIEVADSVIPAHPAQPTRGGAELTEDSQDAEPDDARSGRGAQDVVVGIAAAQSEAVTRVDESGEGAARAEPAVTAASGAARDSRQDQQGVRSMPRMLAQVRGEPTEAEVSKAPGVRWSSIDQTATETILDRSIPVVDGLPVIGYATTSINGDQVVRVTQILESGQRIELMISPVQELDVAPESKKGAEFLDAPSTDAINSVSAVEVEQDNLRIRLSADLSADSLRVLAQKIVSER